jgi:alpha-pyrone synthase
MATEPEIPLMNIQQDAQVSTQMNSQMDNQVLNSQPKQKKESTLPRATETEVYLNRVVTKVPAHDVHAKFLSMMPKLMPALSEHERERKLFAKLANKAQIEHRYSMLEPSPDPDLLDTEGFYVAGKFPTTGERMEKYKTASVELCESAVAQLLEKFPKETVTHLVVTSCTGFFAPGLDLALQKKFGLRPDLERSIIGFMGCYAAINGLKAAWHIVRSQPQAKVLLVNLELCTLHLQENSSLEQILGFMQFSDGCAASLISSEPVGLRMDSFQCDVHDDHADLIQWHIRDSGFDMYLSPQVPIQLGHVLPKMMEKLFQPEDLEKIQMWAVHPGGRSILDVVQDKLKLPTEALSISRQVLRDFGNMSSATIMFVLREFIESQNHGHGLAMAFGPGLTVETLKFHKEMQ